MYIQTYTFPTPPEEYRCIEEGGCVVEWMDETDKRRLAVEEALAFVRSDGRARYVLCLPGWPIVTERPKDGSECYEWLEVTPEGKTGRVAYVNTDTRAGLRGETQ